jgi:hypothetical protein
VDNLDRVVSMKSHVTAGGDSGGPWFSGNTLYGVHTGSHVAWFKQRSLFSQARYIDEALGVTPVLCEPYRSTCYSGECGDIAGGCGTTLYCGPCGGCPGDDLCEY